VQVPETLQVDDSVFRDKLMHTLFRFWEAKLSVRYGYGAVNRHGKRVAPQIPDMLAPKSFLSTLADFYFIP